jgi:hypothetical protein
VVTRQQRDEFYPWLQGLTDEQCWKIWGTYDYVYDHKGCQPWPDHDPIATFDQAIRVIGQVLAPGIMPEQMEHLECELERDEEFRLASWLRKLRYERETVDEERSRHECDDKMAEKLARLRQYRKPRN